MTRHELVNQIFTKKTYLCVGLDTDVAKLPKHLQASADQLFDFNKAIVDATKEFCVAYKINTAFYEAHGSKGWDSMERIVNYIPSTHFKIADAKRGDIGNTAAQYAKAFFETLKFDAITVAPYMGKDSVMPFLDYKDKWTILLGLTSNEGAKDFELQKLARTTSAGIEMAELALDTGSHQTEYLYERVLRTASEWGSDENLMFVIGATNPDEFSKIRNLTPHHFYLVPGVGAQGGSLKEISEKAMNDNCGLLVNASRAVIYASSGEDFAEAATKAAKDYATEMQQYLK